MFQAPMHQFQWIGGPRLPVGGGQAGEAFGGSHGGSRAEAKLGLRLQRLSCSAPVEAKFLEALPKFYDWETSKNVYPEKVSDLVAWRLMLRLLRT